MLEHKISVIVPVYKVEVYLDQCVQSIVDQTYKNLEIILVDDGSPDRCPQMCDEWAQKEQRVRVIHKKNGGLSSARNAGLDVATGEYFGFVDSDDFIAPNMYEVLLDAIKDQQNGIACCGVSCTTEDGIPMENRRLTPKLRGNIEQALDAIFTMQADVSVWCKLYHRTVFDKLRFPEGETNEDFPLIVPTVVKARGMVFVQQWLYFYRRRGGSITNTNIPSEKNSYILYQNIRKIEAQLAAYGLKRNKHFDFFASQYSFYRALYYEKNYHYLSDKIKEDYKLYRQIMKKNCWVYISSRHATVKDKVLYMLVLTKLLTPVYKLFCPSRL